MSFFKWFAARSGAKSRAVPTDEAMDDERACDNCKFFIAEGRYCRQLEVKGVKPERALRCPFYARKTMDALKRPLAPKDWWYANEARHISAKAGIEPGYAKRVVGNKWWHVMKPHTIADKMGLWGTPEEIEHYREAGWDVPEFSEVERMTERERIRQEVLENIKALERVPSSGREYEAAQRTIQDALDSYYKVWPLEQTDPKKKRKSYAAPGLNEFSALDLMMDMFEG